MNDSHRPWSGQRLSLRDARRAGGPVAGRYLRGLSCDFLEDESAILEVEPAQPRPGHGDQVAATLHPGEPRATLSHLRVLTPSLRELGPELRHAATQRERLRRRAAIVAAIRSSLVGDGFLEVETPARVVNPGLEPHLRPFPAGRTRGQQRWLVTSPELHLKRLLAAGYERFFELGRAFRDDERGSHHASEFLMLEWYRSHARIEDLASDIERFLPACADAAGLPGRLLGTCDLGAPCELLSFADAFRLHAALDGHALSEGERDEVLALRVEGQLGLERPTLLTDWPADAAALARTRVDGAGRIVAARMELYIAGVELANGFDELTDPVEQRRRHESDLAARRAAGAEAPPLDEGFLEALEAGIPPSAGMALGVDRLVQVLLGAQDIGDIRLFAD